MVTSCVLTILEQERGEYQATWSQKKKNKKKIATQYSQISVGRQSKSYWISSKATHTKKIVTVHTAGMYACLVN
jgi:hypothetical protein